MSDVRGLSVGGKVWLVMACMAVTVALLGAFSAQRLYSVNSDAAEIRDTWLPGTRLLGEIHFVSTRYRAAQAVLLLAQTPEQKAKQAKRNAEYEAKMATLLDQYRAAATSDEHKRFAEDIAAAWTAFQPTSAEAMNLDATKGREAAVAYYVGDMRGKFDALNNAIEAAIQYTNNAGLTAGDRSARTYWSSLVWILIAIAVTVLFCLGAGLLLTRSISKPLAKITGAMDNLSSGNLDTEIPCAEQRDEIGQLAGAMAKFKRHMISAAGRSTDEQTQTIVSSIGTGLEHLAKGDLTHRIQADLTGPFAKIKYDFNGAMDRLQEMVKSVLATTRQIDTGASEIARASDDLSQRTERQAANLDETAAALDEITATVAKTAGNAHEASQSVADARTVAEEGGQVVETAIHAMDAIAQSSRQITDIIGVIDEIAFQTNLLALNAGVEAARAGDAGRGFAVVASEVRSLAQRSSGAAKQIKTLIQSAGEQVGDGVKFVGQSGAALRRIVERVVQIDALVGEMAKAAEQQSSGVAQVNTAIGQMDEVTQQNAAMVEESTAAARSLVGDMHALIEMMAFFQVGERSATVTPINRPTARPALKHTAQTVAQPAVAPGEWEEF